MPYLQLVTASTSLEITEDHMVFVEGNHAIPASSISVGDKLILATTDGDVATVVEAVEEIHKVVRKGAFAPFTPSGTIVVNNVKASSFITLQKDSDILMVAGVSTGLTFQWLAHTFEFPHRIWCYHLGSCSDEVYTANGISTWVALPHAMSRWFVGQGALLQVIASVPLLVVFFGILGVAKTVSVYYWSFAAFVLFLGAAKFSLRFKVV
jgi:hypothetical protein